jgi:hypothetical protein
MCCVPTRARRAGEEVVKRVVRGCLLARRGLDCGGDEARALRGRLIRRLERFQRARLLQRGAVYYVLQARICNVVKALVRLLLSLPPSVLVTEYLTNSHPAALGCDVVGHPHKLTTV